MSFILLVIGLLILCCGIFIKAPTVRKYKEWIIALGVLLALWGLLGLFTDLLIGTLIFIRYAIIKMMPFVFALLIAIIVFILIHFKIIRL
mgnify:CR=1 FL=1